MNRRALLVASCGATGSISGCLARRSSSPPVSESAIEACEVSHIEREIFDDDPPSIDASVRSVESYDDEYHRVAVESHWITHAIHVLEITLRPAESSPPEDAVSSSDDPFDDFDALHDTLSDVVESGDETVLDSDHDEYGAIRDAFLEAFEITESGGADGKTVVLEHDGDAVEVSLLLEDLHGDGEAEAIYFVSESDTYRVEDHDGEPADGVPVEC